MNLYYIKIRMIIKIYCFHVSEIPQIIKTKSNPWSNKPISDNILREWLEKLEVFSSIYFRRRNQKRRCVR